MPPAGQNGPVEQADRILVAGRSDVTKCDNQISTSKYNLVTFFPIAIREQFRRVANMYFLVIGCIMAVGYYTDAFNSAISPWTTLGPLAFVVSISLLQEGSADMGRHKSDEATNNHPCVVLRRADELDAAEGKRDQTIRNGNDVAVSLRKAYFLPSGFPETPMATSISDPEVVKIAFETVLRMNIRAGDLVLVRNRDMVPADLILLASSSDNGSAYIETSSIDGETNLKLRTSPHLPKSVLQTIRMESEIESIDSQDEPIIHETLDQATKRIARLSALAYPDGENVLRNPANASGGEVDFDDDHQPPSSLFRMLGERSGSVIRNIGAGVGGGVSAVKGMIIHHPSDSKDEHIIQGETKYVAALTSEPPNASVNTYSGKLTLPPVILGGPGVDIPLNADNMLLRGAILRNTEWVIGLACFTGTDTKLVQNSFDTPSKFSQLDQLMNRTVLLIVFVMVLCISYLASFSVYTTNKYFDELWYLSFNTDANQKWPYLPDTFDPPDWEPKSQNWVQIFFLFVTLLNNFVPLSLYVTVEVITLALRIFINLDLEMYHEVTDTRTVARSTTVTDLGQVQYVFSDKTGTLTQNVMRFKRCSVDGLIFGAPVEKSRPETGAETPRADGSFHPLRHLLVGQVNVSFDSAMAPRQSSSRRQPSLGLENLGVEGNADDERVQASNKLTFNAEMFLRVMSLCHTVVVEKDLDAMDTFNDSGKSDTSKSMSLSTSIIQYAKKVFTRSSEKQEGRESELEEGLPENGDKKHFVFGSPVAQPKPSGMGPDGAPMGFAYQAESPDEGALVQSASRDFAFQVVGRDASGIRLACSSPSLLEDARVRDGLKRCTLTPEVLAAETASRLSPGQAPKSSSRGRGKSLPTSDDRPRIETWAIMAVNKFDSDRKRMSVLVRSPPEFGSIPMLLCKGADSSMLDPKICQGGDFLISSGDEPEETTKLNVPKPATISQRGRDESTSSQLTTLSEDNDDELDAPNNNMTREEGNLSNPISDYDAKENLESTTLLGIQAHLGDFASEGLRTLVLGMRVLTEKECDEWLDIYNSAATSIKNREDKLKDAALAIERNLHIVGATAIEDKLQRGVPETIKKLEQAGIKLWVLTGDKRETATEIGYATHVLTPKMHVTEVADGPTDHVRTLMAMEFMRLVKMGKLIDYQRSVVDKGRDNYTFEDFKFSAGKARRMASRSIRRFYHRYVKIIVTFFFSPRTGEKDPSLQAIDDEELHEISIVQATERRRAVRNRAEKIIESYCKSPEGMRHRTRRRSGRSGVGEEVHDDLSLTSDEPPMVFTRAQSAKALIDKRRSKGDMATTELRSLTLAQLTAQQATESAFLVDEDVLSLRSFFPGEANDETGDFDRKKRTILERLFAVDRSVRHGRLVKHLKSEKLMSINEDQPSTNFPVTSGGSIGSIEKQLSRDAPRALVIEGAALAHLLGDAVLEELLFAVASCSESVIACRVSPKQKALLVKLVRTYVVPEPVTLAIGDGANDVGMIQEAHVGVGISGKEGQQAVNASDFAIAQFRFLEELLLVHGRWSFFRQSTVVLFSFYKNALMAGCLIVYTGENLYSGTPLFDEWLIAMLNFVAGIPILFLGFFDRCLDKDYVKAHPEVYAPGRNNELITLRILIRWVVLTFVHIFTLYYLTVPPQANGGGITSAFVGLMRNEDKDTPGNGEGGDLKSVGTVTFTCMIILLAYKVLYESRSLIHGRWPAFTCRKNVGEGFFNRLAYTWVGVLWLSIGFYLFGIYVYQLIGQRGASTFSPFVDTTFHVLHTRSRTWMLLLLVPIAGMVFDVTGKVYANMFFPSQTQIHVELAAKENAEARRDRRRENGSVQVVAPADV